MSNCSGTVCGTGGWTGPLPGDPDNNVTLSAYPTFGGIMVRWSYPTVNGYAVSYVQVYRGSTAYFDSAIPLEIQSGSTYFDAQNNTNRWYYWIKIVSINGTEGQLIGPASAVARQLSEDLLENLTGKIDSGKLAQDLKKEIEVIPFLQSELLKEIFDRETGEKSLADAITDANNGVAQAMTFIGQVNQSRISDNEAMASTLSATAAVLQSGIAAVTEEVNVKVTALDGKITAESQTRAQVVAQVDQKYAGITTQQNARITSVDGRVDAEISARQQAISNVGNRITGVESSMDVIANEVDNIYQTQYMVKLQANGLIGGFGLINDGVTVQAGFDVDTFWIGRTDVNKVKPFIIDGGVVYMDAARIRNADIDTLKIAGNAISATAYSATGSSSVGEGATVNVATVGIGIGGSPLPTSNGVMIQSVVTLVMSQGSSGSIAGRIIRVRDGTPLSYAAKSVLDGFTDCITLVAWDPAPIPGINYYYTQMESFATSNASARAFNVNQVHMTGQVTKR